MKPSDTLLKNIYKGKDAETVSEICKSSGLGETTVRRHAKKMVEAGMWKAVTIRTKTGFLTAYIVIKR